MARAAKAFTLYIRYVAPCRGPMDGEHSSGAPAMMIRRLIEPTTHTHTPPQQPQIYFHCLSVPSATILLLSFSFFFRLHFPANPVLVLIGPLPGPVSKARGLIYSRVEYKCNWYT